jgi:adenosylmethionine-8-amino-7-oxononanoate aminotransferase
MFAFEQAAPFAHAGRDAETASPPRSRRLSPKRGSAPAESGDSVSRRTGTMFDSEQAAITPDFICLSKGITGGYLPLSAVLTTDHIYDAFYGDETARGFLHSHSYTGNPLACRAALAVLDIFEQDQVIVANRTNAAIFTQMLAKVAAHPRVRHFRHLGMIWAFDAADSGAGFSTRFHQAALAQDVFIRPIGNAVYVMPPYVTSADEMRLLADAMLTCLDDPSV